MKRLRLRAPVDPITISLDGEGIVAERGEPVAAALYGSGVRAWARSPKFHRPRGPACFRGACDGCLLRVNGVPNTLSCLVPAEDGLVLETQNTLGTRDIDLLSVADWLFPHGVNHHELFAGVPVLQEVMQSLARRVVGLGVLPSPASAPGLGVLPSAAVESPSPDVRSRVRDASVVVVGAGPAGMAVATQFARKGMTPEVIFEESSVGGMLRARAPSERRTFAPLEAAFEALRDRMILRPRTMVASVYPSRELLVVSANGAEVVRPRVLVLATGSHDTMPAFPGNDVPGVLSDRAAGLLFSYGVRPGTSPLFLAADARSRALSEEWAALTGGLAETGVLKKVHGTSSVAAATIERPDGRTAKVSCDAVVLRVTRSPSYELALQCGAKLVHERTGFVLEDDAGFVVAEHVFAAGALASRALLPVDLAAQAEAIVRAAGG